MTDQIILSFGGYRYISFLRHSSVLDITLFLDFAVFLDFSVLRHVSVLRHISVVFSALFLSGDSSCTITGCAPSFHFERSCIAVIFR